MPDIQAQKELNARIALKFDLTENWTNNKSQILLPGEAAFEKTPLNVLKMKVGDGVTDYEHLPYIAGSYLKPEEKEDVINKTSSFQTIPNDTRYPTEKLVYDVTQNLSTLISQLQVKVDNASHIYVGNNTPDSSFGEDGDIFIVLQG